MVYKKYLFFILIFFTSLFITHAQNINIDSETDTYPREENVPVDAVNYYIDRTEREPRFIQRLVWDDADLALRYMVVIQRREANGVYREIERRSVETNYAEVSLPVGYYRYHVEVYDLFDEYAYITRWREFEIYLALQPVLSGFSPGAFYLDEDEVWEITVRGRNFLPESEFYLVDGNRMIRPIRFTSDGTSAFLVFSGVSLFTGKFEVYVQNPGGLDYSLGTFTIANKKPFDINLSLGYAPLFPVYGYLFKDGDLDAPFPSAVFPLGIITKVSFVPFKRVWGNLGAEVSASFSYLSSEREFYSTSALLYNGHLSCLYQVYFLKKKFAVNVNLGAGITAMQDFHYQYTLGPPTDKFTNIFPSGIAGISAKVFVHKTAYISLGTDFIHLFSAENPMPGIIRPFLMAGYQF
ncbi:MAG: hypothetical protein FWD14_03760 [Treponema sp.]|nr:hypothetical protein [Treponema sp.]